MADHATLAKARKELEDMYSGIPDDSVNLTFGDLVEVKPNPCQRRMSGPLDRRMPIPLESVNDNKIKNDVTKAELAKLPSLDFSRALEATAKSHKYNNLMVGHPFIEKYRLSPINPTPCQQSPYHGGANDKYEDKSYMDKSGMSRYEDGGKGRRPGIPHSNICTICSNYMYMYKHRCLVCGRGYCKQCVGIGMGEMTEGRKCLDCLGKKFSQRYIQRAGQVSCCMRFKYSSEVMQQELKWAERGPRKTSERRYGQSGLVSPMTPRSPITPRTPIRTGPNQGPASFVMASPYSPYASPIKHALPF